MPRKREKMHDSCGNIKLCIADLKHYPYSRYETLNRNHERVRNGCIKVNRT